MIENPSDGSVSVVEKKTLSSKGYICVFNDETTNSLKTPRYHQNIPASSSVKELYQIVSQKSNYKYGTFFLAYVEKNEEVIIDYDCEDTIGEILKTVNQKRNEFSIKQKNGVDPVNVIVDNIRTVEQVS